jgi:hypothetical protein
VAFVTEYVKRPREKADKMAESIERKAKEGQSQQRLID